MTPVIYAGIDEAGYGPRLGPLCVGMSALRIHLDASESTEGPLDVWARLDHAVSRNARGARNGLIPVADSKKLKLPNSGKRHPLTHLEPGVLSMLAQRGGVPDSDLALFERLGISLAESERYSGAANPIPLSTTRDHIGLMSSKLSVAFEQSEMECVACACLAMSAEELNERCERVGSKAAVSFGMIARLLRALVERNTAESQGDLLRVVIDRQGGRINYARNLLDVFPGSTIRVVRQEPDESVYELSSTPHGRIFAEIRFMREAEEAHFPVALASMTAKYVRELAMVRFNAHFGARMSELKPTAGYATDAGRWLKDASPILSSEERRAIVRRR